MAYYLFNASPGDAANGLPPRRHVARLLSLKMWAVSGDEPHRNDLAPGDGILIYLAAPERVFIGRAELASAIRDWTPSEAEAYPGDHPSGVSLTHVEGWALPVPMDTVMSRIPGEGAKSEFAIGVVRITLDEYETVLALSTEGS